ncbi:MAG: ABC transporter permease [Saprospiraceae bacterium]|nr:ABC transporter permease [Saprospiraceae bacterium]
MWLQQIKITLRHLLKHKNYTWINVLGLTLSITVCLLLFKVVFYELSFDKYHENADQIVHIICEEHYHDGTIALNTAVQVPAMDEVNAMVSQFEKTARLHFFSPQVNVPDESGNIRLKFNISEGTNIAMFAEPSFFEIFNWTWLAGSPKGLSEPNTVVITKSIAERSFDNWESAIDQTLRINEELIVTVKGIVEDAPSNSDLNVKMAISFQTLINQPMLRGYEGDWHNISTNDQMYALLSNPELLDEANSQLKKVAAARNVDSDNKRYYMAEPLNEMHFNTQIGAAIGKKRLAMLGGIGLIIAIMACFNFINMATAMAASRAREVGVRKTLGSSSRSLVFQFLGETTAVVLIATLAGVGMAYLLQRFLPLISSVPKDWPLFADPNMVAALAGTCVLIILLAGSYPAWLMSRFQPVKALKSKVQQQQIGGLSLRKVLVMCQFAIAQILIIGTIVTAYQMQYIRKTDLGFNPDLVYNVNMNTDSLYLPRFKTFKEKLLAVPGVESVAFSNDQPSSENYWMGNFNYDNKAEDEPFSVQLKVGDENYLKTYGMKLAAGRNLMPSDTVREVMINRHMAEKLGVQNPEDIIGKNLRIGRNANLPIVGVVENFNSSTLRESYNPIAIYQRDSWYYSVGIKLHPESVESTVPEIEKLYNELFPETVFEGVFFDESIANFYEAEQRFTTLSQIFTLIAILISCLGLFGLSSLIAVQKTREIGIRKVLGASVSGLVGLLSKDFLWLVLIAFVVSAPLAYYIMNAWLQDFQFRIDFEWWILPAAGLLSLIIAMFTVSIQSLRAATMNPVDSIKTE